MKTVKKVVSSKVFKVVAIAAAIYFTAGALSTTAATTAASGGAATTGASSIASTATVAPASTIGATVGGSAAGASSGVATTSLLSKAATAATELSAGKALMYSTGLNVVAGIADDAIAREEKRKQDKRLLENNSTYLPVGEDLKNINARYSPNSIDVEGVEAPSVPTVSMAGSKPLIAKVSQATRSNTSVPVVSIDAPKGGTRYYDSTTNSWRA